LRVFVTTELYPFSHGGIGRLISNILKTSTSKELKKTIVLTYNLKIDSKKFKLIYPHVLLVDISDSSYQILDENNGKYPPRWAFRDSHFQWLSVNIMQALKKLEVEFKNLNYIEFPDFGGLGFATTQEKLLGRSFLNSTIAIRIHSTHSILMLFEDYFVDKNLLHLYDLERKALDDCDLVISHLKPVAEFVRNFYAFSERDFNRKLVIHSPPVEVDTPPIHNKSFKISKKTPIVFTSKIQQNKSPDIFIKACCSFLERSPDYRGDIIFLAHIFDVNYANKIKKLIPKKFKSRFIFKEYETTISRNKIIANSICIFPNNYESFCLAAYEASILGAFCILNELNPAFSKNTPWIKNVNCFKYTDIEDLVIILKNIFRGNVHLKKIVLPKNTKPLALALNKTLKAKSIKKPLVSIVITHHNLGNYLLESLENVMLGTYENFEIIIVDDFSDEYFSKELINKLKISNNKKIKIINNIANIGLPASRNKGIHAAKGKYIVILDADDFLDYSFIGESVKALELNSKFDVVIPQTAYFHLDLSLNTRNEYIDYQTFVGEARASGFHQNNFSSASALFRADVIRKFLYDPKLKIYEDWDLYVRMVSENIKFIVMNKIGFYYRRRMNSMLHSIMDVNLKKLGSIAVFKKNFFGFNQLKIPAYVIHQEDRNLYYSGSPLYEHSKDVSEINHLLNTYRDSYPVKIAIGLRNFLFKNFPYLNKLLKLTVIIIWQIFLRLSKTLKGIK
jgi:glycosyltransferase involved in cell wall biosynthesis